MVLEFKPITGEEFDEFVELPENADKLFEFVGGEIVEVPSNAAASQFSARVITYFGIHLLKNPIAHLTGEAGGYMVFGERHAPDVAVILKAKQPELVAQRYNANPPDSVVEVDFPSTPKSWEILRAKVVNYAMAGTALWLVVPELKTIEVYVPGKPAKVYRIGDTLDGGDVLPGFTLAVKDIFPSEEE